MALKIEAGFTKVLGQPLSRVGNIFGGIPPVDGFEDIVSTNRQLLGEDMVLWPLRTLAALKDDLIKKNWPCAASMVAHVMSEAEAVEWPALTTADLPQWSPVKAHLDDYGHDLSLWPLPVLLAEQEHQRKVGNAGTADKLLMCYHAAAKRLTDAEKAPAADVGEPGGVGPPGPRAPNPYPNPCGETSQSTCADLASGVVRSMAAYGFDPLLALEPPMAKLTNVAGKVTSEQLDAIHAANKEHTMSQETPPSTISRIKNTLKVDAPEAGWRVAGSQLVKLSRDGFSALLARHLSPGDESMRNKVAHFLTTPVGTSLLTATLSIGLSSMPQTSGPVPQRLARELRIKAMADMGDLVTEVIMAPLRQVMELYLKGMPTETEVPELPETTAASTIDTTIRQDASVAR